jgi:diaminohydroxyphosphoribosylaminopyrimidine deaminase/5-amino-6-(5-phosphoribosylamino)uracil reductase
MSEKTNFTNFDRQMMRRCFKLASQNKGFTAPNPMVGAVIVKNGEIISEGSHEFHGGPHAEINAISNAKASLKGAHIYINLEPCAHYGKTPPCSLSLIKQGFSKVFIAHTDPNPLTAGKGIEQLQKAGIKVATGLLAKEALKFNEKYIHFYNTGKPFIALKTASSLDGKIATYYGESQWITNDESRKRVHELRQEYTAILVGINTVLNDNPALTVRLDGRVKHPTKVILDTTLKTPHHFKVLSDQAPVIIATTRMASKSRIKEFDKYDHVQILHCPLKNGFVDIEYLVSKLGENGIDSLLIEGGGSVNFSFVQHHLAQKIYAFVAPKILGGKTSKTSFTGKGIKHLSDAPKLSHINYHSIGDDILLEGYF